MNEKLLWAECMRVERLDLQSLSAEVSDEMGRLVMPARRDVRIHASQGHSVAALTQMLADVQMPINVRISRQRGCDRVVVAPRVCLAGFHLPVGGF